MDRRVLLIDDDADLLTVVCGILRGHGYDVATAVGGAEGLRAAAENPPHLIVLDLLMPEMSGMEVFRRLKEDEATASIPIIFLTGLPDEEFSKSALSLGAEGYVPKPCDGEDLLAAVQDVIEAASS